MNLKVHSGGMTLVMWEKSAGRCGRGLVSARKATFVGSYGEGGGAHLACGGTHLACGGSVAAFLSLWKGVGDRKKVEEL
jgi:hypothetical protein